MQKVFQIPLPEVIPSMGALLTGQGIPTWVEPDERTRQLAANAIVLYKEKAKPVGMLMEIDKDRFTGVFEGDDESPVNSIYRMSDDLALFAVTIGQDVCDEISRAFRQNDFALGSMLDAASSEGTEMTAQALENVYRRYLREGGRFGPRQGTLRFSPGYCGWHITAQRKVFEALRPGSIRITLNKSYLMQPIKSISGVVISGRRDIFDFEDVFSFCRDCTTHSCRDRIRAMTEQ